MFGRSKQTLCFLALFSFIIFSISNFDRLKKGLINDSAKRAGENLSATPAAKSEAPKSQTPSTPPVYNNTNEIKKSASSAPSQRAAKIDVSEVPNKRQEKPTAPAQASSDDIPPQQPRVSQTQSRVLDPTLLNRNREDNDDEQPQQQEPVQQQRRQTYARPAGGRGGGNGRFTGGGGRGAPRPSGGRPKPSGGSNGGGYGGGYVGGGGRSFGDDDDDEDDDRPARGRGRRRGRFDDDDDDSSRRFDRMSADDNGEAGISDLSPTEQAMLFDHEFFLQKALEGPIGLDYEDLDGIDSLAAQAFVNSYKTNKTSYETITAAPGKQNRVHITPARSLHQLRQSLVPKFDAPRDSEGYRLAHNAWLALEKNNYYSMKDKMWMCHEIARLTNEIIAEADVLKDEEVDRIFDPEWRPGYTQLMKDEAEGLLTMGNTSNEDFDQGETDWEQEAVESEDDLEYEEVDVVEEQEDEVEENIRDHDFDDDEDDAPRRGKGKGKKGK